MDPTPADSLAARFPRVAVVHEWLTIPGGSEKVVCAILALLPQAELFTSVYDPAPWPAVITARAVHTSLLDRIPGATRRYRYLLPLMDAAFRSFDLSGFDLIVSSNHACAKNVRKPAGVPHVCYCHTPMRYAWDETFLEGEALGPLPDRFASVVTAWLRRVDRRRSAGPDVYVANSTFVAQRIRDAYGRDSEVIHPPVEIARLLEVERDPDDAYVVFGRLVPYKRADIAIDACARLGRRLIVAGSGRDYERLQARASERAARTRGRERTRFLGEIADSDIPRLFSRARALVFPGLEDFGMVPVEAQAAGVPVIAYGAGGVRDSVIDGVTGVLYEPGSVEGLCEAILRFESLTFDDAALRENARRFAPERFADAFGGLLLRLGAAGAPADNLVGR